jgi:hypothetical protein
MTTTRERREAKAARLEGWAEKRAAKADAGFRFGEQYRGDTAFWTQPGRIIERERVWQAHIRAGEDQSKAAGMTSRAAGITSQLNRSIYSDDTDALERLEERIAELVKQRDQMKAANASFRKAHRVELATMTAYRRDQAMPHQSYQVTNLSAEIRRNAKRLADLRRQRETNAPIKVLQARRPAARNAMMKPSVLRS